MRLFFFNHHGFPSGMQPRLGRLMRWTVAVVFSLFGLLAGPPDLNLMNHRHWTHREGLAGHSLQGISQDQHGFMWFAAQQGAIRFDGRFMRLQHGHPGHAFPRDDMTRLHRDHEGVLWWGTHGQGVWRFQDQAVTRAYSQDAVGGRPVRALFLDHSGALWVGTGGNGLFRGEGASLAPVSSVSLRTIKALAETDGTIWAGGAGGLLRGRDGNFEKVVFPNFAPNDVQALLTEGDKVWVADGDLGLWCLEGDRATLVFSDKAQSDRGRILTLARDRQGVLWFGTTFGLGLYADGETRFFESIQGIPLGRITALFEDREGYMWVANFENGVHRFNPGLFQTFLPGKGLQDALTWTVFGHQGVLWLGRDGGRLTWLDARTGAVLPLPEPLRNIRAFSLADDGAGGVLMGTLSGLMRWDGRALSKVVMRDAGGDVVEPGLVFPLFVDRTSRIWFGMAEGLGGFDGTVFRLFQEHGLDAATVQSMAEDENGALWLGTDKGLLVKREAGIDHYPLDEMGVDGVDVLAVGFDARNRVVFSVTGAGLWVFDADQPRPVRIPELEGQSLFGVLSDAEGNLWIPSNIGVFMVTPSLLDEALDTGVALNRVFLFGQADGMVRAECNMGGSPGLVRLSDGRLVFATTAGAVLVDPDLRARATQRWREPTVILEKLTVDGRDLPLQAPVLLPPDFQQLALHFSAIEHRAPGSLNVYARLAGFDREWDQVNALSRLDYTHVPPGEYQFEVRAFGRGDLQATSVLPVTVPTPWFAQGGLLAGLALAAAILGAALIGAQRHWFKKAYRPVAVKHGKVYMAVEESRARLARAQHQIDEVGGQASQNEVVTHLLHNMGNVLNSVSVSAGVIEKLLRGTGVYGVLTRIGTLFPETAAARRTFLAHSPRARRLPETYTQIADLLDQHQQDLFDEVANLQVQSAHMKELVLSVSEIQKPIFELFDINILIEDAVKMQSHTLRKYSIEVEHDLLPLEPVRGKKSQILQILVNLIKNACEAMLENEPGGKRLISILSYQQDGFVVVEVNDSGPGIAEDHMAHLFGHGFTTKVGGHGFGLHFCRKVMREMEGDLTVVGRGPLGGAAFKLLIRST
ncbi:sensor histidine kinase [Acanthopleuribacter pedis]|nr:sensor histidine kinase [Acanthopleuribacter pedis]